MRVVLWTDETGWYVILHGGKMTRPVSADGSWYICWDSVSNIFLAQVFQG